MHETKINRRTRCPQKAWRMLFAAPSFTKHLTMTGKQTKKATTRWNKTGPIAAQLFRDIFFGKYKRNSAGKFDFNEIYNDPTREYTGLAEKSFYNHIESVAERVAKYKKDGSGLGTEAFRRLCRLHEPPPPEDCGKDKEEKSGFAEESDPEDSTFASDLEDDITLESFEEEEESAFKELKETGNITDTKKKQNKQKNISSGPPKQVTMPPTSGATRYTFTTPNGHMGFAFQPPSGFDGSLELSEDNTQVICREVIPDDLYDAVVVYKRLGLHTDNVHVVALQAEMDRQKKLDILAMGRDPSNHIGEIWRKWVAFDLGEKVEPTFFDNRGQVTDDIWIDGSDHGASEWIFFWLKKKAERKGGKSARLNRNRRRRQDENNGGNNGGRPAPAPPALRPMAQPAAASPANSGVGGNAGFFDADSDANMVDPEL